VRVVDAYREAREARLKPVARTSTIRREVIRMRLLRAFVLGCSIVVGSGGSLAFAQGAASTESRRAQEAARLNEWLDARYEEQLDFSPIEKTRLGRKDDYDRIDDFSEAGRATELNWLRQTVRDLTREFDRAALTAEAQTSYDLWIYDVERAERAWPFRRRGYVFHQMDTMHTQLPQVLINFHRVAEEADMAAYIARIGEIGRAIGQLVDRAKIAAAEGVHAPRFAYDAVLMQARALLTGAPFGGAGESPLKADANTKIEALVSHGKVTATRAAELRAAVDAALLRRFEPAYEALIKWVDSDLPNTDAVATGVWKLPDGPAFYSELLAAMTTTAMTADEIHELGLAEVARIQAEMEAIKRQVGFAGTLQEFFTALRSDPKFRFPNTDEGREGYLQASRDFYVGIEARLGEFFGLRPKGGLVVKRVEAFREQPGAAQHYLPGTPDGSRPGTYYVHLIDMNAMPKVEMESVAYHEGIPGHHMQIAIAQELTGVPRFRTQSFFTAYTEGWGLYAERLAKEMGGFKDPYSDFGRLGAEIWRAIRLVVDTGLHAKGWSEEQAVDYFLANGPTSEGQVRAEIRRYIVRPGQATAYKIGMLKILELRERARAELGEQFDIRGFHDAVLGGGALPLSILERRVDNWIAAPVPSAR
jgi:uncharacterized protein (DUF885 family)